MVSFSIHLGTLRETCRNEFLLNPEIRVFRSAVNGLDILHHRHAMVRARIINAYSGILMRPFEIALSVDALFEVQSHDTRFLKWLVLAPHFLADVASHKWTILHSR